MKYRRIKGTKDILPTESWKWQFIEKKISETLESSGYKEIRTPIFEVTQLFTRGIGEETDVVSKEMYTFLDKGSKSLTLRPELTAPVIRAYIENNLNQINPVNKLYYIGSLFRQERPQKGRLRQFNQFGLEIIGSPNPEADAEVIRIMYDLFSSLGITDMNIKINSIGSRESRKDYLQVLEKSLKPSFNNLCPTCQKRFYKNILRIFDCKNSECQKILDEYAPAIVDHLNEEDTEHFETVKKLLNFTNTPYTIEKKMVRGLDYYTRTTFEITSSLLGSQDAICGGGRYDHLVEDLDGSKTPAVGVACGMERLIMVLDELSVFKETKKSPLFCVTLGDKAIEKVFKLITDLKKLGIPAEMDLMRRSIKAQMRQAGKNNAHWVAIIGENEIEKNILVLKNMVKKEQIEISLENAPAEIAKIISLK